MLNIKPSTFLRYESKNLRFLALLGAAFLAVCWSGNSDAEDYKTDTGPVDAAMAGYSAGGLLSGVGEAIGAMVRTEYPGSSLIYEPGNPIGGLTLLSKGERPFAFQTWQDLEAGVQGIEPFREKIPPESFSVVARVVKGMVLHVVAREDFLQKHQVNSMSDIVEKKIPVRINTNQKGNLVGQLFATGVLEAEGVDLATIESWGGKIFPVPNKGAGSDLMRNNRLDVMFTGGFLPGSLILELASAMKIRLLPIDAKALDLLYNKYGFEKAEIPASVYDFLDQDLPSPATSFVLVAGSSATDADVYKIVRSLHRQFDYYRALHPSFAEYSPSMLTEVGSIPFHPVAEAYYREAGLLQTNNQ